MAIAPEVVIDRAELAAPSFELYPGDALDAYSTWPTPTAIISDGAYGVGGFFGDPRTPDGLAEWYAPHIEAWSKAASPATTLWFWGTEIGWATVHPLIAGHDWDYVQAIHWHKGIRHVAGNVNGDTIRRFPVANEICVFYQRRWRMQTSDGLMSAQDWMRYEWRRSGLPMRRANDACDVKDAATRKYFAREVWLWYPPPPETMAKLVEYANTHGNPEGRPYYSLDGEHPVSAAEWQAMRYRWTHRHGITNVWDHPPVTGAERFRNADGVRHAPRVYKPKVGVAAAHLNQKPLELMRRIVGAVTSPGDVVWEPFGGLCSASVAAIELGRRAYASETDERFAELASARLAEALEADGHPVEESGV